MLGRILVVAGEDQALAEVAAAATKAGASVAVVSRTLPDDVRATVRFRADPGDRAAWQRIAMHVEQHLGPVDGVATDTAHLSIVEGVFAGDFARRGHGTVVAAEGEPVTTVLTRLGYMPSAAPARPPADAPDR